ncbi:MAG: hypothetical protein ABEJ40_12190 [Haloarculaceae archaeon]
MMQTVVPSGLAPVLPAEAALHGAPLHVVSDTVIGVFVGVVLVALYLGTLTHTGRSDGDDRSEDRRTRRRTGD